MIAGLREANVNEHSRMKKKTAAVPGTPDDGAGLGLG